MEETGLSLRTFHNLLLVLAQLPFSLVLMMHQLFFGMSSYPRNLHVHVLGQSYWSPPHNLGQLQTAPDTPTCLSNKNNETDQISFGLGIIFNI